MKLASKFTLTLICGIVVVHAGSAAFRVARERALFEQDVARDGKALGRALSHAVRREWHTRGERAAMQLIEDASSWENENDIRWVWLDSSLEEPGRPGLESETVESILDGAVSVPRDDEAGGGAIYTYVPVQSPPGRPGALEIREPLADERRYVRQSVVNAAIATIALIGLCAGISWLLGQALIGRRVSRLVQQARLIGRGNLEGGVVLPGNDELSELAREMDRMCDGLRQAVEQIRLESERRSRAIEQLRHADRLTSAGTLASGMAHELGTPINVIEGYAQLMVEDASASPRTRENADVVMRQCRRMAQIIQQLLTFTRRGAAKGAAADARDVLHETLLLVKPMVKRLGVKTDVATPNEPALVNIASNQLQQVLTNILINGLQAMKSGGRLSIGLMRQRARHPRRESDALDDDYVSICVEDTGEGMDPETAERVFEPFFTTKDVGEGTGLGLSVAYGIVADHGGWIDVNSSKGSGSAFTVYLPPVHAS